MGFIDVTVQELWVHFAWVATSKHQTKLQGRTTAFTRCAGCRKRDVSENRDALPGQTQRLVRLVHAALRDSDFLDSLPEEAEALFARGCSTRPCAGCAGVGRCLKASAHKPGSVAC